MNNFQKQLEQCCVGIPSSYPPLEVVSSDKKSLLFKPHLDRDEHPYSEVELEHFFSITSPLQSSNQGIRDEADEGFRALKGILPVGSKAPDFELCDTLNDATIKLSDLSGQYVAIMFVAITCPPARLQIERWNKLSEDFVGQDVRFLFIYSKERHAGEGVFKQYKNINSAEDRLRHATEIAQETCIPVLLDDDQESTLSKYGKVPNQALVINKNGYIIYKSAWANSVTVQQALCDSLHFEANESIDH